MKDTTVLRALACVFILTLTLSPESAFAQKPRIAVLSIENRSGWWPEQLGLAAAEHLTTRLVNSGKFSVIERARLTAIIDEQGFQMTGAVDPSQVARLGVMAGAEYLITGSIVRFGIDKKGASIGGFGAGFTEVESAINIRVISTETGEIVWAGEGEGKKRLVDGFGGGVAISATSEFFPGLADQALAPAIDDLMTSISGLTLPSSVPPAEIVGSGQEGTLYINHGQNFGVQVGARYDVFRVVDEIIDAQGTVLDRLTERVGTLEVTRVLSQSSVAFVVEGEAKQGDMLEAQTGF